MIPAGCIIFSEAESFIPELQAAFKIIGIFDKKLDFILIYLAERQMVTSCDRKNYCRKAPSGQTKGMLPLIIST
jgi:hypothetical protein